MDVVKRYIDDVLDPKAKSEIFAYTYSKEWVKWIAQVKPGICSYCFYHHGKIYHVNDSSIIWPEVHQNCHCHVENIRSFLAGTLTTLTRGGVDFYLCLYHRLPDNYITKEEARVHGWNRFAGNLDDVLPGKMIGGDIYRNWDGRLPTLPGRIWYEADLEYDGGYRNGKRILFSNDGLVFVTFDHYLTFSEVFWEDPLI